MSVSTYIFTCHAYGCVSMYIILYILCYIILYCIILYYIYSFMCVCLCMCACIYIYTHVCMWVIDCLSIYRLTYMGVLHIKMPYRSVFENRFRVDKLFHEFPHHGDSTPVEVNPHDPFRKGMCKKWLRIFCPDCTRTRTSSFCFSLMFGNLCDLRLAKMD